MHVFGPLTVTCPLGCLRSSGPFSPSDSVREPLGANFDPMAEIRLGVEGFLGQPFLRYIESWRVLALFLQARFES